MGVHFILFFRHEQRLFGPQLSKTGRFVNVTPHMKLNGNCTQEQISNSGELLMIMLYGGKKVTSLNELRASTFHKKLSSNTKAILPEHLPPTSDASRFHSLRTYHQVQAWKGIKLPADDWGFIRRGRYLLSNFMS